MNLCDLRYYLVYNDQCPNIDITSEQQAKINIILTAMDKPEKVVPV